MASENFITVRFTKNDEDIKTKYWNLPDGERSDAVRSALRLWFGIDKRITFPVTQEQRERVRPSQPTNAPKVFIPSKGGK